MIRLTLTLPHPMAATRATTIHTTNHPMAVTRATLIHPMVARVIHTSTHPIPTEATRATIAHPLMETIQATLIQVTAVRDLRWRKATLFHLTSLHEMILTTTATPPLTTETSPLTMPPLHCQSMQPHNLPNKHKSFPRICTPMMRPREHTRLTWVVLKLHQATWPHTMTATTISTSQQTSSLTSRKLLTTFQLPLPWLLLSLLPLSSEIYKITKITY